VSPTVAARLKRRGTVVILLSVLAFLLASIFQLVIQAAIIHDVSVWDALGRPVITVLLDTSWGHYWLCG
jgi:hypothetical protein